jgi:hypothetical protein
VPGAEKTLPRTHHRKTRGSPTGCDRAAFPFETRVLPVYRVYALAQLYAQLHGGPSPNLSCPRLTLLPHRPRHRLCPTFNLSLIPLWKYMRRRRTKNFSLIHSPPNYNLATLPLPYYLSFKTSSSNLINVAVRIRDYRIGSNQL